MTLGNNGNVSIGNFAPDTTYKLQVGGVVNATEYKVNGTTVNWPDYVFDTTIHKLAAFPDVESYLIQNHHRSTFPLNTFGT
ncbi:hypothetical protein A4H97_21105 [Niastella yeongjuensis]|uniref:Uncharacterized protein n=2 Tax=Niastella yeongjuensis TaxID=354355 RepID=A0A1V9FCI2_9BACT|nr:hypothetical protein A4H97_21105 [Niastella yeongjuensis]SEP23829.1 hypothetical protein SAMN05660816_04853 [Niastella yeongjuensis]